MELTELSKYQSVLEKKRDELLAAAPARTAKTEPGAKSGDWIDQSSQESDLHVHLALKQTDAKLLRAVEEALLRVEHGTYGICTDCEEEISRYALTPYPGHACVLRAKSG